jgi:hypothetical protein
MAADALCEAMEIEAHALRVLLAIRVPSLGCHHSVSRQLLGTCNREYSVDVYIASVARR